MSQLETLGKNTELEACLQEIEEKLNWGKSSKWTSYDFEKLSANIQEATGMALSANTLKRVWGRLPYDSKPSTSTLNILAQYLEFADWRDFVIRNGKKKNSGNFVGLKKKYLIAPLVLLFLPAIYILLGKSSMHDKPLDPSDFSFASRLVTEGIPNSVVFRYSTPTYISQIDKLEIQQSWDESKRHSISSKDSIATSIYYAPGYFISKLVVNDSVVKEHDLLIPSSGWLGILEGPESPIYLAEDEIIVDNKIEISNNVLNTKLPEGNSEQTPSRLYYIKDFQDLYLDDFTIDMVVKGIRNSSQKICKVSTITLYCQGQVIIIPLAPKGCVSELNLMILDQSFSGKTNDLSNFGVKMEEDISISLTSVDGKLEIYINDLLAYSLELKQNNHRSISGIRYSFIGSSSINKLLISNSEQVFLSTLPN